jgi:hypothetical protein
LSRLIFYTGIAISDQFDSADGQVPLAKFSPDRADLIMRANGIAAIHIEPAVAPIKDSKLKVWRLRGSGFIGGVWGVEFQDDGTMSESTKKNFKEQFDKLLDRVIAAQM